MMPGFPACHLNYPCRWKDRMPLNNDFVQFRRPAGDQDKSDVCFNVLRIAIDLNLNLRRIIAAFRQRPLQSIYGFGQCTLKHRMAELQARGVGEGLGVQRGGSPLNAHNSDEIARLPFENQFHATRRWLRFGTQFHKAPRRIETLEAFRNLARVQGLTLLLGNSPLELCERQVCVSLQTDCDNLPAPRLRSIRALRLGGARVGPEGAGNQKRQQKPLEGARCDFAAGSWKASISDGRGDASLGSGRTEKRRGVQCQKPQTFYYSLGPIPTGNPTNRRRNFIPVRRLHKFPLRFHPALLASEMAFRVRRNLEEVLSVDSFAEELPEEVIVWETLAEMLSEAFGPMEPGGAARSRRHISHDLVHP